LESIRSPRAAGQGPRAAREFYHGKLGLLIEKQDQNAIAFRCGGGTHLDVTKTSTGTAGSRPRQCGRSATIRAR